MKNILILLLIVISYQVFSQVSNTKVVRITNNATAFGQPLSEGNILIDLNTDNCYLVLKPLLGTSTLSGLTINDDYKEIVNSAATDSSFVWVEADTVFVDHINTKDSTELKINENLTIEADGTLRVDNDATTWDDLRVTLDKGSDAAKLKDVGIGGIQIWHFEANKDDAMSFTVQLPHTWKEGSRIYPHIHWIPKTAAAGNVEWQFEYSWANYNPSSAEVFPSVSTITSIGSTGSINLAHRITSFSDGDLAGGIDGTGKEISSILICRVRRNAGAGSDTYGADVGALFFDIHIEINTMGSREEFVK